MNVNYADTMKIQFEMNIDSTLPSRISADKVRLSQILINLANNAIKFTEPGKSVSINVRSYGGEQCCNRVGNKIGAECSMMIQVIDQGIGISNENISNLFQAFYQVARNSIQGSGLGLHICHELVHLMRGHICCQSQLGQGSTFTVVVPLVRASVDGESNEWNMEEQRLENEVVSRTKILVAEDNKVNQMVIGNMLKRLNCTFDMVSDGRQACEAFEQGEYFLVLMDLMMPVMDGFEATKRIVSSARYAIKQPRVVALTASVTESEIEAALGSGCHSVVSKPINAEKLRETIHSSAMHYREHNRSNFILGASNRDFSFFPT